MSKKDALTIAKEVGITLKNLKTFEGHDAGLGINADICLNGKIFAHAYDDAHGGMMEINAIYSTVEGVHQRNREIIQEVGDAISKYPEHEVEMGGGKTYSMKEDLEGLVNALVDEAETQKMIKRDQKKGILIKTLSGYSTISWKAGTIANMLKKYTREADQKTIIGMVQKAYDEKKAEGKEILNLEYLKSIGVKI